MVSRGLLATVGLCLFATLVAATQIADVSSNYYAGRSGPIMITGQQPTFRDSHAVLLDSSRTLQSTHIPSSLPLTSLAHVIAQFMGLSEKIGAETSEAQQLTSALDSTKKQPKAQVIFNVESVGKSTIDRFQLAQLANPSTPHVSFGLSSPSITPPAASISIATSVATGSPIASHGIVGQRWKTPSGAVASAFTRSNPKETFAAVSNLADLVATHTNGRGLTISASGAENLAWSFGVNKALADARRADGWTNNYCLAMVHDTVFESVSTNSAPALQFQVSSLEKQITSSPMSIINNLGSNMHATVANHVVTLTYTGKDGKSESVNFDLKQKADTFFLAELQYALDLPSKLKSVAQLHSALQDDEQDLIVFSFAGFTKLIEKYGRESEQFRGGLKMFTQLFPLLASQYASLFESHPTASTMQTIVFLGAHPTVLEKQDPRQVEALLKADNVKNTEFYPHVYVSTREVQQVCAKLNKDLAPLKYSAYCPSTVAGHMLVESASSIPKRTLAAGEPSGDANPDYYFPTDDEIGRYQIALWLSIIMTLIAIGAIYSLAYMPFKKDTMLYSSFNPNWEDRKRR